MTKSIWWIGSGIFILIATVLGIANSRRLYAQDSSVTVRIDPAMQVVPVGESFAVQVVADLGDQMSQEGLAGYEFNLAYDRDYLEVLDVVDAGQLAGPNSRTVGTLGPSIDNIRGQVTFGGYSYQEAGERARGPTGTVTLASITLMATQTGETELTFESVRLMDTQSNGWPDPEIGRQVLVEGGIVTMEAPLPSDSHVVYLTIVVRSRSVHSCKHFLR